MKARNNTTTNTLARVVAIVVLALGFMTSAVVAQEKSGDANRPDGYYHGVETSEGTLEAVTGNIFGNTVVMNYFNEDLETRCLTVSLDYATTQFVPNSFIVMGGSWSLVVISRGVYAGTIYGKILGGNVLVSENSIGRPIQSAQLNLQATGALGSFEGNKVAALSGFLDMTTDLRAKSAVGRVVLDF